jgi:predicted Fe-S protein YdhL (DUF1289 family)
MSVTVPSPASPCVKICVVDPVSGLCIGCGRTIAEIAIWSELDAHARQAIVADLEPRLKAARSRNGRGGRVRPRGRD